MWKGLDPATRAALDATRKFTLTREEFDRLPYEERLKYCIRPEHIEGPDAAAWSEINAHLNTSACNLRELVEELGRRRFGRTPRVGDCFAGGGSIPFEVARLGCQAFGSDLNPVAALLTLGELRHFGGRAGCSAARERRAASRLRRCCSDR